MVAPNVPSGPGWRSSMNETFSAYTNQTTRKAGGYAYLPYEQLSAQFGSTEFCQWRRQIVPDGGLKVYQSG